MADGPGVRTVGQQHALVLSHAFMVVSDLERARVFYRDEVGLELLLDEGGYLRWDLGSITIGMEQAHGNVPLDAAGLELELRVADVDQTYAEMSSRGVVFRGPPADMPWDARHAFFTDPDGYAWSIWSPQK